MSLQGSFQLLLRMPKCDINRQPLLLYFILYLFVIRSFDNLYLARFHDLQCSLMTFRCYPCVSCLNTSYTGSLCCLSNRFGYRWSYSLIKCLRNNILRRKFLICDQICKCFRRCQFHFVIDFFCSHIKCTTEDSRESKYVVDLVREITSSCGNNFCSACLCILGKSPESGSHMQKQLHLCSWS